MTEYLQTCCASDDVRMKEFAREIRERGCALIGKPRRTINDPLIRGLIVELLDDEAAVDAGYKRARAVAGRNGLIDGRHIEWHYDDRYRDGQRRPHTSPLAPGDFAILTLLWAEETWSIEMGCTGLIPGSHRMPPMTDPTQGYTVWQPEKDDCLAFLGSHVLHSTGINRTDRDRTAWIYRWQGRWRSDG